MLKSVYIAASGRQSGKSAIALGLMQLLAPKAKKIAVFRPIISDGKRKDSITTLLCKHFKLNEQYEESYAYTSKEATELINNGSRAAFIESVLAKYKQLEEKYDFILCVGSDFFFTDQVFEFGINVEIASNIGSPVLLIVNAKDKTFSEIRQSMQSCLLSMQSCEILSTIVNHATLNRPELETLRKCSREQGGSELYAIPEDKSLASPTLGDIVHSLNAEVLTQNVNLETHVETSVIAAMHAENFLGYLEEGALVITPGDRPDIIFATLAAKLSPATPTVSGVLLTGGIRPAKSVVNLLHSIPDGGIPMLITKEQTIAAANALHRVRPIISPKDTRKINTAIGLFEHYVDCPDLVSRICSGSSERMSALMFQFGLLERARKNKQRIVLCEGEEERILLAANVLLRQDAVDLILLGKKDEIELKASRLQLDISKATVIDPAGSPKYHEYAEAYCEYRKAKGMTMDRALQTMLDATYFGTMMVKQGDADGMVSGAVNTTAHTIRPAFEFIKTRPGSSVVSSVFLMCLQNRVLVFGDCAVNPNPTAPQLAEIAIASAKTAKVFGIEPRVAMLSYSTGSSGKGADVDIVVEATKIAKELEPDLLLEGPIQYDAAVSPDVARTKLPGSKVAGQATVFIFPDLNTGNNTYKAVQRAANAVAIGPVLQGLNKPVNDLSRGCLVPDIINTVVITALQAAADKKA